MRLQIKDAPQKPHWVNQIFHPTTPSFPFRVTSKLTIHNLNMPVFELWTSD
jgi:hypothetical protein